MIVGIIYKYTSPSGKSYIGQTTNESHRRATWFCEKYRYAGTAINRARKKYGAKNFKYEVLHKKYYFNKKEASMDLDRWEIYYIGYYNTFKEGYNNTIGGATPRGVVRTQEFKNKISHSKKGIKLSKQHSLKISKALTGHILSKAASNHRKEVRRNSGDLQKVGQYSKEGTLIKVWSCVSEVSESLGINIQNVYRATKTLGIYKGYYWRNVINSKTPFIFKNKMRSNNKKVLQYDLNGNFIKEFNSIAEAAKSVEKSYHNISACCSGRVKTAYNYKWKYKI